MDIIQELCLYDSYKWINPRIFSCLFYMIQPDELFSYWIFAWYIVYLFGYRQYSPKFALFLGSLANLFLLAAMILFNVNLKSILYFILVNLLFKIVPLWTLRQVPIRKKDIQSTFALFLIYVGWILWKEKGVTLYRGYRDMLHNQISMPGMSFLAKLNIL